MKRAIIVFVVMVLLGVSAYAETDTKDAQQNQPGEGQQMMCPKMHQMQGQGVMQGAHQMPMMQMSPMMGHGMMMNDMMQMMMDIMNMQEKIIAGVKPSEKKQMLDTLKDMKTKMQDKMSMGKCMMGGMMGGMMSGGMMGHGMMGGGMAPQPGPEKEATEPAKELAPKPEHQH
jgi:hypothetical protein